jgi:hypothetical protein
LLLVTLLFSTVFVIIVQTTSVIMEAVDFMDSMDHHKELHIRSRSGSHMPRPPLERQMSSEELPYRPIRHQESGLRLAEVEALREEVSASTSASASASCSGDDFLGLEEMPPLEESDEGGDEPGGSHEAALLRTSQGDSTD